MEGPEWEIERSSRDRGPYPLPYHHYPGYGHGEGKGGRVTNSTIVSFEQRDFRILGRVRGPFTLDLCTFSMVTRPVESWLFPAPNHPLVRSRTRNYLLTTSTSLLTTSTSLWDYFDSRTTEWSLLYLCRKITETEERTE